MAARRSRGSVFPPSTTIMFWIFSSRQRRAARTTPIRQSSTQKTSADASNVRRYFMSISEAVQLILRAGTIGRQGEIFVLDMGEPIRIQDLARDLIMLSGFAEDDFEIKYIGPRPGEKLVEEILIDEEKARSTEFKKVFIAPPIEVDAPQFGKSLTVLLKATEDGDKANILRHLQDMDIGFRPAQAGA